MKLKKKNNNIIINNNTTTYNEYDYNIIITSM